MFVLAWLAPFLFTLLVEAPVYVLATRRIFAFGWAVLLVLLLNVATHPVAWGLMTLGRGYFPYGVLAIEGAVVLAEGLLLFAAARSRFARQPLSLRTALAVSLAANSFSAGVGLLALN
jgi:hypothetical protein